MQELIEFLEKRGLKEKAGSLKDGKLDLNYKDIGIEGARLIAKVLENDNSITELRLNGQYGKSNIGAEGVKLIATALKLSKHSITHFELANNNIGAEEIKLIVEALKDSNSITELNLGYNNIDDKGAAYIAELITSNNCINRIYIEENKITTEGAKLILQALKSNSFSSVTLLEFGPSSINEKIIDDISEYLSENKVELNKEAEKLYKDGYSLYKEGKYSEAIEKYNAGLRKDEDSSSCKEGLRKAEKKYAEQLKGLEKNQFDVIVIVDDRNNSNEISQPLETKDEEKKDVTLMAEES